MRHAIREGLITASHDISDGGMACAAAEMALSSNVGVALNNAMLDENADLIAHYFGEDQSRYLLAVSPGNVEALTSLALEEMIPLTPVGQFGGEAVQLGASSVLLEDLRDLHEDWLPGYMEG